MAENKTLADMHTHSLHSHDSECPIEDMLLAHLEKGCKIMAVTNHFDTWFFDRYDIFTPIKESAEEVDRLNEKYGDKALILKGFEISEGFWYPEIAEKVYTLADFDAVVGSAHTVRREKDPLPYSWDSFSDADRDYITKYMSKYFSEVLVLLSETDFDILAHLTCPLRYINGKFKKNFTLDGFEDKIDLILRTVIEKGIALEVNTSSFGLLGDFMPYTDIIKRYKELGGELITLGSDAHVAENACCYFSEAITTLKEIGFEGIYYYKKRKPIKIEI